MEFRDWYTHAIESDKPELAKSELALAETLAYRDETVRTLRTQRFATYGQSFNFYEKNVKIV